VLLELGYKFEDLQRHEIAHCNGWKHFDLESERKRKNTRQIYQEALDRLFKLKVGESAIIPGWLIFPK